MIFYLNEESIRDRVDADEILSFLKRELKILDDHEIKIHTRLIAFKSWAEVLDSEFDFTLKKGLIGLYRYLIDVTENSGPFYYFYLSQNKFQIENIPNSSMADAADKIINKQLTAILNIPKSNFCGRDHIPVIKSPYNPNEKEELANIACFDSAKKIFHFHLLNARVRERIKQHDNFILFSKEYYDFVNKFNFLTWMPKTHMVGGKLDPNIAFPASSNEKVKNEIASWKIIKGSTEDNISRYRELGGLIVELHGYKFNPQLSNHYGYEIYEAGYGREKLLISLDVENGAFEVIEYSGTHIGVYSYIGTYISELKNQKKLNDHSLKKLPVHMFLFK